MSKLKVAWAGQCLGVGGADAYMLSIIKYAENLEFTGIAVENEPSRAQLEWATKQVGGIVPFYIKTAGRTHIEQAAEGADILITWSTNHIPKLGIPVVELAQNSDDHTKHICDLNNPDYRVGCSVHTANTIFGDQTDAVIFNAVDPARCTPRWDRTFQRNMWGFDDSDTVILFAGRLVDEKAPMLPLYGLQHLPDNYKLLYAGEGYRGEDLVRTARELHLHERVYLAEHTYHIGDLFNACDIFTLPSDFEGLPLAVLEAWLSGIPTITSDMPSMLELQTQYGDLSKYVKRRCSPEDFAQAALDIDDDPDIRGRATRVVWEHFNAPRIALHWEQFLHQAVTRWRQKRMQPSIQRLAPIKPMETSKAQVQLVKHHD